MHLAQHVFTPHFHFGEETHTVTAAAGVSALLGLTLHTFFDGVAIASGFLVSGRLGILLFPRRAAAQAPRRRHHRQRDGGRRTDQDAAHRRRRGTRPGDDARRLLTERVAPLARHGLAISAGVTLYVAASNLVPHFQARRGWITAVAFFGGALSFFLVERLLDGWLR